LQKDESRWQSTDSLKAYRNTSAFRCSNSVFFCRNMFICQCFVWSTSDKLDNKCMIGFLKGLGGHACCCFAPRMLCRKLWFICIVMQIDLRCSFGSVLEHFCYYSFMTLLFCIS